jgi:CheY-like chemotaxis protein
MTPPRILLVDDQRQVSRVLRSSLELSGREYLITEVASAEEALAELDRVPIDLLVTDLRLPAMSGLQLVERAKTIHPNLHTILITGNATEEVRQRAETLGVVAFLPKPIGTNLFLEIVETALEVAEDRQEEDQREFESRLRERLSDLRREVGAEAVYLVDARAEIIVRAGNVDGLEIESCLGPVMSAHRASLTVSQAMGNPAPSNFHHLDGRSHDLFMLNVGDHYGLLIALRGGQEVGRIGAVRHYGGRTADVLEVLLNEDPPTAPVASAAVQWEEVVPENEKEKDIKGDDLEEAAKSVDEGGAEDFWEKAAEEPMKAEGEEGSLTYEEARELGLLEEDES